MQVGVLGELLVRAGDELVEVRRGKPRIVLLSLVAAAGGTVPAATLVERLWAQDAAANPLNALQTLVAYLRRTLAAAGASPLVTRGAGYALDLSAVDVDAHRFETLVRQARQATDTADVAGHEQAQSLLDEALLLWRGEAYADASGEDFIAGEVARLHELRSSAAELQADVLLALGRNDDAVQALRRLVRELPLRERLHEQLMVALYRSGRQAEALQAYQDARALLVDELGIEPSAGLRRTEQMVLSHDARLEGSPLRGAAVAQPPPAAPPPVPRLPTARSLLLGRDEEMERLRGCLRSSRLVTITGPGGAGKTRLALELAHGSGSSARWVDLSAVQADSEVAAAVAAAMGISTLPGVEVLDRLRAAAPSEPVLLVLDTCEHVVEGAADVASLALAAWPSAQVLATSRRPLEVAGELAWPLSPLILPDPADSRAASVGASAAVQLFVSRAAQADPAFRLTDAVAADVAAICIGLDGLPLAIELAAALCDVLTPAAIRGRLEERFGLLVRGPRDLLPRQRTLRAAIDWSVELLAPHERAFFAALSVFQGTFSLDAVAAVTDAGPYDAVDLLTGLVRQSLVVRVEGDYYVLLDSLRAYAAELLSADVDAETVRARHALYYAHVAETGDTEMRVRGQDAWVVALRRELPNFRTALVWCFGGGAPEVGGRLAAALAWFWAHEGMLREAETWLERASRIVTADALTRSHVLTRKAMYLLPLGRLREAETAAAQAYVIAAQAGDDASAGAALLELGVAQWALGDLASCVVSHQEALERLTRAGDAFHAAMASVLLARTSVDAGDPEAEGRLRSALTTIRAVGDAHLLCVALHALTRLHLGRGEVDDAADAVREALEVASHVGYQEGRIAGLILLADVSRLRGELLHTRTLLVEVVRAAESIQHLAGTCEGLERLAAVVAEEGDAHQALSLLLSAQQLRERAGVPLRAADRERVEHLRQELLRSVGPDAGALLFASTLMSPKDLLAAVGG